MEVPLRLFGAKHLYLDDHANARLMPAGRLRLIQRCQSRLIQRCQSRLIVHVVAEASILRVSLSKWKAGYNGEGEAGRRIVPLPWPRLNGLYETELIHARPALPSVTEVEFKTMNGGHWWSHQRLHQALTYSTPNEIETAYAETREPTPARE